MTQHANRFLAMERHVAIMGGASSNLDKQDLQRILGQLENAMQPPIIASPYSSMAEMKARLAAIGIEVEEVSG